VPAVVENISNMMSRGQLQQGAAPRLLGPLQQYSSRLPHSITHSRISAAAPTSIHSQGSLPTTLRSRNGSCSSCNSSSSWRRQWIGVGGVRSATAAALSDDDESDIPPEAEVQSDTYPLYQGVCDILIWLQYILTKPCTSGLCVLPRQWLCSAVCTQHQIM
jgi:hypothetical protein